VIRESASLVDVLGPWLWVVLGVWLAVAVLVAAVSVKIVGRK
jgi:uncharacterized membrane protein YwaF